MKIKCTEEERQWLIKYLGEYVTENYPWNAGMSDEDISCEIEYLMLREGFLDNFEEPNEFGKECLRIHDSLYYQNVTARKSTEN